MAYFNQEMKKKLVSRLKTNFPKWKFSVSVKNNDTVMVKIKSAPLDLWKNYVENVGEENLYGDKGYSQINHYHLGRAFSDEYLMEMERLLDDINLLNEKESNYTEGSYCGDFVQVGYYVSLKLGYDNNKPFVFEG